MQEYFYKHNVTPNEYLMQDFVYNQHIVNVPRPVKYRPDTKILKMHKISQMCVSDMYGESMELVPQNILQSIRECVSALYFNNIEYPDITGYNFIWWDGKIWIIDFEHASYNQNYKNYDPFILDFIKGVAKTWNPRFA